MFKKTCLLAVCIGILMCARSAAYGEELAIRVAPQTLVLSSSGGQLTVHTNVPYSMVEHDDVALTVAGMPVTCHIFADSLGNLVAQCSKEAAKEAIGSFDGKRTAVTVGLSVESFGDDNESITVKK